jgi:hypothetical protein
LVSSQRSNQALGINKESIDNVNIVTGRVLRLSSFFSLKRLLEMKCTKILFDLNPKIDIKIRFAKIPAKYNDQV